MRVSYHAYHLRDDNSRQRYLFNIKYILDSILREPLDFKRSFLTGDEHFFLIQEDPINSPEVYFLILTRNNEIIKAINDTDLTIQDIRQKITADERLGVGSFIYVGREENRNYIAFAGQLLSPRINRFWDYINEYLEKKELNNYKVIGSPLIATASLSEVLEMDFWGKTTIQIEMGYSRAGLIRQFFGIGDGEYRDIESIEISIKPKRRQNIKPSLRGFLSQIGGEGIDKLIMKAKEDVGDSLTELYVIGQGALWDSINPSEKTSRVIKEEIANKVRDHIVLRDKINQYYSNGGYENGGLPTHLRETLMERVGDVH